MSYKKTTIFFKQNPIRRIVLEYMTRKKQNILIKIHHQIKFNRLLNQLKTIKKLYIMLNLYNIPIIFKKKCLNIKSLIKDAEYMSGRFF